MNHSWMGNHAAAETKKPRTADHALKPGIDWDQKTALDSPFQKKAHYWGGGAIVLYCLSQMNYLWLFIEELKNTNIQERLNITCIS